MDGCIHLCVADHGQMVVDSFKIIIKAQQPTDTFHSLILRAVRSSHGDEVQLE
jgi:hypothetical protein